MITINDIYFGAQRLINEAIRTEHSAQGHNLTNTLENSLNGKVTKNGRHDILSGFAVKYAKTLNDGIKPEDIKSNVIPGLIKYFILRGVGAKEAERAAVATYIKWKKEGMSTEASKRFSSTGERQHFIERAFEKKEIALDEYMLNTLDFSINEHYSKTKSETI